MCVRRPVRIGVIWAVIGGIGLAGTLLSGSCLDSTSTTSSSIDSPSKAQCEARLTPAPELPSPVEFQLHTHAHSNHGSSSRPSSMQFDSYQAQREGLGGVVWSEHLGVFDQSDSVVIYPGRGTLDPDSLTVTGLRGDVTRLGAVRTPAGQAGALLDDSELVFSASGGNSTVPAQLKYQTQHIWIDGKARWPETLRFNRPISSGAAIDVTYRLCTPTSGPLHVVIRLSWHVDPDGTERQYQVHYVLQPGPYSETRTIESPGVVRVTRGVPQSSTVTLDVLRDASLLPDGDDDTIVDISWYVESNDSTVHCAAIHRVALRSQLPYIGSNWSQSLRFSERYEQRYGVRELVAFEGWVVNDVLAKAGFSVGGRAGAHMNVVLPTSDPGPLGDFLHWGGADLVARVHALCGVVAVNHPFGYALLSADSSGQLAWRSRVITFLLANHGFGADMLEVGLPDRGDALDVHLQLWDRLSAAGIHMCGVGTSDAHGWRWDDPATATYTENHNPYVTWVWLRGLERQDLVSALRRCRAFFGNPFAFTGSIDFSIDSGGVMGEEWRVNRDSALIVPRFSGVAGLDVWLIQVLSRPGTPLPTVRQERLADPNAPFWVSTTAPSFVRFEVRKADGTPAAFSNPVWIER